MKSARPPVRVRRGKGLAAVAELAQQAGAATRRDLAATHALAGLLADGTYRRGPGGSVPCEELARAAVALADALLAELDRK